jgi:hypothetical protein
MTQFADMSDSSVKPMRNVAMRFFCVRRSIAVPTTSDLLFLLTQTAPNKIAGLSG